jgi:hypothetical protein
MRRISRLQLSGPQIFREIIRTKEKISFAILNCPKENVSLI